MLGHLSRELRESLKFLYGILIVNFGCVNLRYRIIFFAMERKWDAQTMHLLLPPLGM